MVSILKCDKYNFIQIKKLIKKSLDNIGGIEKYIKKGDKVLLKVNLVIKKSPEKCATSNPVFTAAIASVLSEYGAKVIIGDSPGGPFSNILLKSLYTVCQMDKAAKFGNAKLNLNTESNIYKFPDGKILKKITVANYAKNCDKIISVCRLKTHCMTTMTGAVKNMFGIIPGTTKAEYHFNCPDVNNFAESLIDICEFSKPVLSFMDAIYGMEGEGPTAGTPRKIGAILVSENPYELDYIASKIINIKADDVPTIKLSIQRKLFNPNNIKIIGNNYKNFVVENFNVPKIRSIYFLNSNSPKILKNFINKNLKPRPEFNYKKCIGCSECAKNCPPKAIKMTNKKPNIIISKCIRCYCCQELCPKEAVYIFKPFLLKILSKF